MVSSIRHVSFLITTTARRSEARNLNPARRGQALGKKPLILVVPNDDSTGRRAFAQRRDAGCRRLTPVRDLSENACRSPPNGYSRTARSGPVMRRFLGRVGPCHSGKPNAIQALSQLSYGPMTQVEGVVSVRF